MESYKESVRIRLCFEERGMLRKAQVDQGLAKSWYLVNADILSIGQLVARIDHDFRLRDSCPQGVMLEMSGFVLPPAQSTRILQNSDLISVRRKQDGVSGAQSKELLTNSLSVDNEEIDQTYRIRGLRAPDEFEKEAGGYQGELSEDDDADFSFGSGKNVRGGLNGLKKSKAKESSGKKRKRSLHVDAPLVLSPKSGKRPEGLDVEPSEVRNQKSSGKKKRSKLAHADHGSSEMLPLEFEMIEGLPRSEHIEGGSAKTEKKKKKKKLRELVEQTRLDVNSGDITEPRETNAQEARSGKGRKVKSVKETADLERPDMKPTDKGKARQQSSRGEGDELNAAIESRLKKLTPEASREGKKSRKCQDAIEAAHEKELLKKDKRFKISEKDVGGSSEVKGNAAVLNNESNPEPTNSAERKQPSRSARRKKAKKRWLREQAKLQSGVVPKKDDVEALQTDQPDINGSETSEEESNADEMSAEEEILPTMVAPGHIRFERDEDVREEGRQEGPLLSYPEVRCKQQGQAWGQEKSQGRYSEDGYYRRNGKMENRSSEGRMEQLPNATVVASKIDFENLPLLNRAPWVGDLLAYRLVELTASWTPELSSYRVGKVSTYYSSSEMIFMMPVPEYPIHVQQSEDVDEDEQPDEDLYLPPYNSDGSLEVKLATLMEVRVLEEGPHGCSTAVQADLHAQQSIDVNATTMDVYLQPVTLSSKVPQEHLEPSVCINSTAASNAVSSQNNQAENRNGGDNEAVEPGSSLTIELEPILDQPSDAGWQDLLSEDINKKKLELSLKAGKALEVQNGDKVQGSASKDGVIDIRKKLGMNGAPIIRHRHMRAGTLGPTMAMLRANQLL